MKYIRSLYAVTLIAFLTLFVCTQVKLYHDIEQKIRNGVQDYNNIFAAAAHSTLHEVELLLDMLGTQLLTEQTYKDAEKSHQLMASMMARFSFVVGLGLTDTEGNFRVISANINLAEAPGLRESDVTRPSFDLTLTRKTMVVGQVYYHRPTGKWIIPLRKALRDASGDVIGVMATGISLESSWDRKKTAHTVRFLGYTHILPEQLSLLIHDTLRYRIYVSPLPEEKYPDFYSVPIPRTAYKADLQQGMETLQVSEEKLKQEELSFFHESSSYFFEGKGLFVSQFNKRYTLWSSTAVPKDAVNRIFLENGFLYRLLIFAAGAVIYTLFFLLVLKKEEEKRDELAYQAMHDSLTGLFNRSALHDLASRWTGPNARPFYLLFIDLDNFKHVNDTFGHTCGNSVLIEVARRIKNLVPQGSEVMRVASDEFAVFIAAEDVILTSTFSIDIIKEISEPYEISGIKLRVGASVGISQYPQDGISVEQLMVAADLAMYDAKKQRNSYAFYTNELREMMHRKASIENHLRNALESDEIYMVFQPQVAADGSLYGAEALIRWENEALGIVPPSQFIGVAEEAGLMSSLGALILQLTCSEFSRIIEQGGKAAEKLSLSINVSVKQILERNFKEQLLQAVDAAPHLRRVNVTVEITESLFIDELEYVQPLLQEIRDIGITISLDDFGTGYSSLSILRTLPIDELKIDMSFVNNIISNEQDSRMIHSIIEMGHKMNMKVLAEGVENREQLVLLDSYGCDLYQGFYFSRPLRPDDFLAFLQKHPPHTT
jgi:diguanylate cyclase (GGDEF)-like protein